MPGRSGMGNDKGMQRDAQRYLNILYEIGAVHEENITEMLEDLEEGHIELKAFLLRIWQDKQGGQAVWESLRLEG